MTLTEAINQGIRQHNAGQLDQAERIYRQVLQQSPNHPDALHLLGILHMQKGQPGMCIELIARAIAIKPAVASYHSNLAEALRRLSLLEEAEVAIRRSIALDPKSAAALINLGVILHASQRNSEAASVLRQALELDPNEGSALVAQCSVLKDLGDFDAAIEVGRRAADLFPRNAIAHNNLAASLEASGRLAAAEGEYRQAISLHPQFVEAMDNLGTILYRQGDMTQAVQWWQKALAVRPDHANSQWNLALALLAQGDWERGWPMFECRLINGPSRMYYREYPGIPPWTGFDLKGKSILLFPEQGYGDVIQFARFIPVLAEMGARVILHLPGELVELMKRVPGVWKIVGPDEELPSFDTYRALLSLPMVLKTTPQTLPRNTPYVGVDPVRNEIWAKRFEPYGGKKKVGIVWSGRPTHKDDARRSMRLSYLAPLAELDNVTLFSLQKGDAARQLEAVPFASRIVNLDADLNDFADTAAAIANLDLVIGVDTAVIHLAGALGRPVWLLIASAPDYRWMFDREDSPWNPTMRIFRQKKRDDWDEVINRVREELSR